MRSCPNGDVIFKARATGGSLSPAFLYTFRWSNGTITLAQPSEEIDPETFTQAFDHDLAQVTTDNRWLATLRTGPFPNITTDYGLTDGAARQSIFSLHPQRRQLHLRHRHPGRGQCQRRGRLLSGLADHPPGRRLLPGNNHAHLVGQTGRRDHRDYRQRRLQREGNTYTGAELSNTSNSF